MKAMLLQRAGMPLQWSDIPDPGCGPGKVLIRVRACGVCRTDLHIVDGELPDPKLPLVPGHEIVGEIVTTGTGVDHFTAGDRVGVSWLGQTCGHCRYCASHRENLCDEARFTGYQLDGGYAEFTVADSRFVFPVPLAMSDAEAAPLFCAGLIGYRSLKMAGDASRIGIYGFGAAAHIVSQLAVFEGREVYAFTRPGDTRAQNFAKGLGAVWAGGSDASCPVKLDAAIIYAPAGELVPLALSSIGKGGTVVCAGIHMSDIPAFPYRLIWGERIVCSVANLTRSDGEEFLRLAASIPVRTVTETLPLSQANLALTRLRNGELEGAAVLVPE
jgi:propanol-preferring alcohol dehydrogenase